MATIIISHPVADYSAWRPIYDADVSRRDNAGLQEIAVGQKSDDPKMVYMIWKTDDVSGVEQMLKDPSLAEKMKEAGVTGPPELTIIN
jgi:hypothetical protein